MTAEETGSTGSEEAQQPSHGGMPGDGVGRREVVGGSGVHPFSAATGHEHDPIRTGAEWGQGLSGPAGYEDSGTSEIWGTGGSGATPPGFEGADDDEDTD